MLLIAAFKLFINKYGKAIKMRKNFRLVKITEEQLREMDSFTFLGGGDVPANGGQSIITADGKLNDEEFGKVTTSGKVAGEIGMPNGRYGYRDVNVAGRKMALGEADNDGDHVDDYFEPEQTMDMLNDNNPGNDNTIIPEIVIEKMNIFIAEVKRANLMPKKQAALLSKIIASLNINALSPALKTQLRKKIQ